jgi:drug/metabolite transporter (DMT)-like permease
MVIKETILNNQIPPNQGRGQLAILLCAVLWSTSGLFIKLLSWHPIIIAGGRSLIAAVFLLAIRQIFPRRWGGGKDKPLLVFAAGASYAATMLTFVIANKLTASANAILLQYSAPVWACLLAWLMIKEKPRIQQWAALVLVVCGMIIFFKDGLTGGAFFGDALAVISGILFGAHSVFMRMQKEGNPADSLLLSHIITAAFAVPFFFLYPPDFTPASIGAISFMGIFEIGCTSLLFSYGIRRVPVVQAMLTAAIEPVLNPLWVLLATGEIPSLSALTGGAIIVGAVVLSSIIGQSKGKAAFEEGD